jgi:hypothetical protein
MPVYARGRSRLRPWADPAMQVQDAVLAVSVALFQLLGTYRGPATSRAPGRCPAVQSRP